MRHDKPILTLKEFCYEVGKHRDVVVRQILAKGKCRFIRDGPKAHYRIPREAADEYFNKHTFGGSAYGKPASK